MKRYPARTLRKRLNSKARRKRRTKLLRRQRGLCADCGGWITPRERSLDHRIPLAVGGTNDLQNLALVHKSCNAERARTFFARHPWLRCPECVERRRAREQNERVQGITACGHGEVHAAD